MSDAPRRHPDDPRFWRGVAHFDAGDYFAAHEEWEEVWLAAHGGEKEFLAGLIQAAVGLLKQRQGKDGAAQRLLARALVKLQAAGVATPVDVRALVAALRAVRAGIAAGGADVAVSSLPMRETGGRGSRGSA